MTDHTRAVYQRADGKWAWRITAANGQIVATDGNQQPGLQPPHRRPTVVKRRSGAEDAPHDADYGGEGE